MRDRSPDAIVTALTSGTMALQGQDLTILDRRAVAEYITGRAASGDPIGTSVGRCESTPAIGDLLIGPHWSGWGAGGENLRFQSSESAGLGVDQVPGLTLKWAFGFPESTSAWGQPAVAGGRVYVGSQNGVVYSLDAKTGCSHWTYVARGGVRTAISVGALDDGHALFFGDTGARVYAIDAATGAEVWSQKVESHPGARITGAPTLHEDRLYVPVSSIEEVLAADPDYGCCTFRGSIVALDAVPARLRDDQGAVCPRDREERLGYGEPPALAAGQTVEHLAVGADAPNGTAAAVGRKNRAVLRHGQAGQRGALGQALGLGLRFAVEIAEQHPVAKADDQSPLGHRDAARRLGEFHLPNRLAVWLEHGHRRVAGDVNQAVGHGHVARLPEAGRQPAAWLGTGCPGGRAGLHRHADGSDGLGAAAEKLAARGSAVAGRATAVGRGFLF